MIRYIIPILKCLCTALLLMALSCTEDINLQLKDTYPRLVVDGRISTDTTFHVVRLSRSGSYFDSSLPEAVSNARVTVADGVRTVELIESYECPGYYLTPVRYYGVPGRTYYLRIEDVDIDYDGKMEVYEARSGLNPVASIDSVRLEYDGVWDMWKVLLYARDPAGTKDYYSFSVSVNDSLFSDRYSDVGFADDRLFDGNYAGGLWVQTIKDKDKTGGYRLKDGDWVKLKMCGITKEFYEFLQAVQQETGFKAPLLSGPPANVVGNISNGALGFFHVYSYTEDSVRCTIR